MCGGVGKYGNSGSNPYEQPDPTGGTGGAGGGGPGGAGGAGGAEGPEGPEGPEGAGGAGGAGAGDFSDIEGNAGEVSTQDRALLDAINRVRREHGLNDVQLSDTLSLAAERNDIMNNATGNLDHHFGVPEGSDGEITGFSSDGMSPDDAVNMWLNSPSHREILLDPNQSQVGVSILGDFATADFI